MRTIFSLLILALTNSAAAADKPDVIKPGMTFKELKAALVAHDYEVDAQKYGLAMASVSWFSVKWNFRFGALTG